MNGGPSHVDTFDPKPALAEVRRPAADRRTLQESQGQRLHAVAVRVPQARPERHRGQRVAAATSPRVIDDCCVIRSMHTDVPNHEPALLQMHTGNRPADPALARLVAALRPGHRERESARLRRPPPQRRRSSSAPRSGATASSRRNSRRTSVITTDMRVDKLVANIHNPQLDRARAARAARPARSNSIARHLRTAPRRRRPRRPDPRDGDGLPHAARGDGDLRHQPRAASRPRHVRRHALRPLLPARPPPASKTACASSPSTTPATTTSPGTPTPTTTSATASSAPTATAPPPP